jgi:membrane-associated phospholipid phosphatase
MGDGPFWMIVLFITALTGQLINSESFRQLSVLLMFGLSISNIVFVFCKTYVKRRRPYANVELHQELHIQIQNRDPGHGSKELESFPSGHVLWTTLCIDLICSQFGFIAVLLFGWMIPTMMYLRLYLGVHYPSDIFASLIISSINVAITLLITPSLMECINGLRYHTGYIYGYWAFISIFIISGFKSWLKRV